MSVAFVDSLRVRLWLGSSLVSYIFNYYALAVALYKLRDLTTNEICVCDFSFLYNPAANVGEAWVSSDWGCESVLNTRTATRASSALPRYSSGLSRLSGLSIVESTALREDLLRKDLRRGGYPFI